MSNSNAKTDQKDSRNSLWQRLKRTMNSRHPWRRVRRGLRLDELSPVVRRVVVGVVGGTILLLGVVMIFLPGPSVLVIPLGLIILATEFLWARRILRKVRRFLPKGREAAS